MSGSTGLFFKSIWLALTNPSATLSDPEDSQRARALSASLLLAVVVAVFSMVNQTDDSGIPPYLVATSIITLVAYGLSRTRQFRVAGLLAITALAVIPTYAIVSGFSDTPNFYVAVGRLLLLALLCAYLAFSIRASLALALLIGLAFLLVKPANPDDLSAMQAALLFLVTAGAIFFIFMITRQYENAERKRAQEALSASEARYRAIVENQTEMISRWLPDETVTFVNEAYCRFAGKTREALTGSKMLDTVYADDLPHVQGVIRQLSPQNPTVAYEHRVYNAARELRWHQWTDKAIYDSNGTLLEYQSVGRDITDLKRAEEAERKQREFAEALANTSALISSTLDLDEVLDRILDQVASMNSTHTAEIILLDGSLAYVPRSRANTHTQEYTGMTEIRFSLEETRNLREMVATGQPMVIPDVLEYDGWLQTHAAAWVRSSVGAPIRLGGETIGFLCMNSDTPGVFTNEHATRLQVFANQAAIAIRNARMYDEVRRYANEQERLVQKRTAELELARQRLSAILDGSGDGIYYTESRIIQYANAAFCKLTGYSQEELVGSDLFMLRIDDNDQRLNTVRETLATTGLWRGEMRLRRKDGTTLDVGMTVALIGTSNGSPSPAVTVVRDITREKTLHLQRTNLVAYASHELRTPITNMKTRLYLLRRRPELLEDHLKILDDVTERMGHLVEDLLDISRMEHGLIPLRREEINIQTLIQSVFTLQKPEAERKNIDLRCDLMETPVNVPADRERIIQVVTNLVTNAINYTPAGGRVVVSVRQRDNWAEIEVEDNGIGIAPENLPYIFQPFYRVVSVIEGSGLGLSIAKEIVELHGGMLQARSELNRGSVFTLTLPLIEVAAEAAARVIQNGEL